MRILFSYFAIILLFWSCGTTKQNATLENLNDDAKLVISYNQTSGFNEEIPEYKLELYSNRQMYLTAIKNLDKDGKFLRTLSEKEYNQVIASFNAAHFFKFEDEYSSTDTDLPTKYLYFSDNGKEKTIRDYYGAPEELKELEFLMQSFLDRVGWEKMSW